MAHKEKLIVLGTIIWIKNDTEKIFVMTVNRSTKYFYYRPQGNMAVVLLFRRKPEKDFLKKKQKKKKKI